ncbi:MAG: glutaredoxin family protein [Nitrospinae bacterium]|nr:glutaredoxin family protein [Nitrospinota bacterium]
MHEPVELLLYSKEDCPLCGEMAAAAREASRRIPLSVTYVDVAADPRLQNEYGLDIPLLFHNGVCIAKHRITPEELVAKLKRRMGNF